MKNKIVGVCPNCGANVVEREKGWFCENRECRFALWKDNAYFKRLGKHLDAEYSALLTKKKALYPEYRKARDEMQDIVKAQKNVELFFAEEKDSKEKEQTR